MCAELLVDIIIILFLLHDEKEDDTNTEYTLTSGRFSLLREKRDAEVGIGRYVSIQMNVLNCIHITINAFDIYNYRLSPVMSGIYSRGCWGRGSRAMRRPRGFSVCCFPRPKRIFVVQGEGFPLTVAVHH